MNINRDSFEHGKAVAAALLHELECINGHYEPRKPLEDQEGVKLVSSYLDAYAHAPEPARRGFAAFIGDYLVTTAGGSAPDAAGYRREQYGNVSAPTAGAPRSLTECKRHAEEWLKWGSP